jgi:Na+-transporting NADH:ubiquinone oxidoreductase subunit C
VRRAERERLLELVRAEPALAEVLGVLGESALQTYAIDLETGATAPAVDPAEFDALAAARDPVLGRPIPSDLDLGRIERRARHAVVHVVRGGGRVHAVVLPVYGRGYASVIHGFVALGADLDTILGIRITAHEETPGVGSEIESDEWRRTWKDKRIRGPGGNVRIRVVDPETPAAADDAAHRVDGITGVTRSAEGVGSMVRYWLGDDGFGPFLDRLRREAPR